MAWRRAARLTPWDKPLDFDLHVNLDGEPRIPFAHYVQPKSRPADRLDMACTDFPQFRLLPAELQQRILFFCDDPTLFQLMHVSLTRHEAEKLFWSDPDTWYCVDGEWLRTGGHAGTTYQDLSFLACVEHVNVHFEHLESWDWTKPKHQAEMEFLHMTESERQAEIDRLGLNFDDIDYKTKIYQMWQLLRSFCPRLTHILISTMANGTDPWDSPQDFLGEFVQLRPHGIDISVNLGQGRCYPEQRNYKPRAERSLWRLLDKPTDITGGTDRCRWEKVLTDWTPRIVLPPPKVFQGPVGAFSQMLYRADRQFLQDRATELLLINAIERHFYRRQEPFACFNPDCRLQFDPAGDYLRHVVYTWHDKSADPPEEYRALFAERFQKLDRWYKQYRCEPFDQFIEECDRADNASNEMVNHEPYDEDQAMIAIMEEEELYYEKKALMFDQRREDADKASNEMMNHEPYDEDQAMIAIMEREELYYEKKALLFDHRREGAERAFLYQLQLDSRYATGGPATESKIWHLYQEYLDNVERDLYINEYDGPY